MIEPGAVAQGKAQTATSAGIRRCAIAVPVRLSSIDWTIG